MNKTLVELTPDEITPPCYFQGDIQLMYSVTDTHVVAYVSAINLVGNHLGLVESGKRQDLYGAKDSNGILIPDSLVWAGSGYNDRQLVLRTRDFVAQPNPLQGHGSTAVFKPLTISVPKDAKVNEFWLDLIRSGEVQRNTILMGIAPLYEVHYPKGTTVVQKDNGMDWLVSPDGEDIAEAYLLDPDEVNVSLLTPTNVPVSDGSSRTVFIGYDDASPLKNSTKESVRKVVS